MAKRRVSNPLFDTEDEDNGLGNLADPSFLNSFDEGIDELQDFGNVENPEVQVSQNRNPFAEDVRSIPMKPKEEEEEGGFFKGIKDYLADKFTIDDIDPYDRLSDMEKHLVDTYHAKPLDKNRYQGYSDNPAYDGKKYEPQDVYGLENFANIDQEPQQEPQPDLFPDMYSQLSELNQENAPEQKIPEIPANIPENQNVQNIPEIDQSTNTVISEIENSDPPKKPELSEEEIIQSSGENPKAVEGAIELAKKNPYIMSETARLNNIGKIPEDLLQYAQEWEKVLTNSQEALSEREASLQNKLQSGNITDFDKLGIALAISVPIIMGLMYGAPAFASSLGGALQEYAKLSQEKQKNKSKYEEELLKIPSERLKLSQDALGTAKLTQDILNNIPDKQVKTYLRGKPVREFGDDFGIGMGDEEKVLWMNTNKIHDNEDLKKVRERTKDAEGLIGDVANFNKTLNDVEDIIKAIQDQDPGLLNVLASDYEFLEKTSPDKVAKSTLADILSMAAKVPGIKGKKVELDIIGIDGKSRKVNAIDALQQSVKALQNNYNTAVLKGSRLTENVMKHWGGIMFDPTSISQFMSSGIVGWEENSKNLRNIMNRKLQEELVSYGFIREPLEDKFPVSERQILRHSDAINREIVQNPDQFKDKVR